jgi:hypothetical protein
MRHTNPAIDVGSPARALHPPSSASPTMPRCPSQSLRHTVVILALQASASLGTSKTTPRAPEDLR